MLSPSDFGFHNALKKPDGTFVFIDFEYFGWDDPAKLLADFLHHPAMNLTFKQKINFLNGFIGSELFEEEIFRRLKLIYPVVGLKWCLLILNVCSLDVMQRKAFAKGGMVENNLIEIQLEKAKAKIRQLKDEQYGKGLFETVNYGEDRTR